MVELLILADDFTGALDTGVQFAARGASTTVVTDPNFDFSKADPTTQVLVMDAETRHLPPREAYRVIYRAVQNALSSGVSYIYKKTDSALRGNVGSELSAAMAAAGVDRLPFIPAFPKTGRVTRRGIHYIQGVPVAESVFGQDPFESVRFSDVRQILAQQADVPAVLWDEMEEDQTGIAIFDAETDEDLRRIGQQLGKDHLHLSAGCAGFAAVLADLLQLRGKKPPVPSLYAPFFVVCGSVNLVTRRQLDQAERSGFRHFCLTPAQKLHPEWVQSESCTQEIRRWLEAARQDQFCILDTNDPEGSQATLGVSRENGWTMQDVRVRISTTLGTVMERLLSAGLEGTLLCTGGDTLLALMRAVGVTQLTPVRELFAGVVLSNFVYQGKPYSIISKSGGFGEPDLLCQLAAQIQTPSQEEDNIPCLQSIS